MTSTAPIQSGRLWLPPVPDQQHVLADGSTLTIRGAVADDPAQRRTQVLGAQLYAIAGLWHEPANPSRHLALISAYAGKSSALLRVDASYRYWVLAQRRILPAGLALIHRGRPYDPDLLSYIEARVIAGLSTGPGLVSTLNRHTSANLAGARLTRADLQRGQAIADEIAHHVWTRLLDSRHNPPDAPASNNRELAVRIVRASHRALDLPDVVQRLAAHPDYRSTGNTPEFSTRRDLLQREDRGRPRFHRGWHRGRRLFWNPAIRKSDALAAYDHAKPRHATRGPACSTLREHRPTAGNTLDAALQRREHAAHAWASAVNNHTGHAHEALLALDTIENTIATRWPDHWRTHHRALHRADARRITPARPGSTRHHQARTA